MIEHVHNRSAFLDSQKIVKSIGICMYKITYDHIEEKELITRNNRIEP